MQMLVMTERHQKARSELWLDGVSLHSHRPIKMAMLTHVLCLMLWLLALCSILIFQYLVRISESLPRLGEQPVTALGCDQ